MEVERYVHLEYVLIVVLVYYVKINKFVLMGDVWVQFVEILNVLKISTVRMVNVILISTSVLILKIIKMK